ncbi:MAG: ABC transporter permease [Betaproteobacteria bacterium]|nr:ABC transporter permease [Betaproteobacteria bacterium]MBI2960414.1 ABC transporter permease [Betaproteobacteria bacterium]
MNGLRFLQLAGAANVRPFTILALTFAAIAAADLGFGALLHSATIFSVTQLFATLGLAALGLGLTMIVDEFDLSIPGSFTAAGAVAVLTGADNPWLGIACGVATGLAAGAIQGALIVSLGVRAVGLTLGGFLTLIGITYVLTGGSTIAYSNQAVSGWLHQPTLFGLISNRGVVVLAVFLAAAAIMFFTRLGRDIIATGSNRAGAPVAGVNTAAIIIGVFSAAGALAALGGVLLSYSLQAASATQLSDTLVAAASAAILGGVSLSGGKGRALGVAAGVLTICLLRSGLSAIGAKPYTLEIVTGTLLLVVAIFDAPRFLDQMGRLRRWLGQPRR